MYLNEYDVHSLYLGTIEVLPPPGDLRHVGHLLLLLCQRLPRRRLPRVPAPHRTGKGSIFYNSRICSMIHPLNHNVLLGVFLEKVPVAKAEGLRQYSAYQTVTKPCETKRQVVNNIL